MGFLEQWFPTALIVFLILGAVSLIWHLARKKDKTPTGSGGRNQSSVSDKTRRQ